MERTGRRVRSTLLVILALSIALVSCHGDGHRAVVAPPVLTLSVGMPLADVVAFGTLNAYAVPTTPGVLYKISVTAAGDDVDLLYFASDSSFTFLAACSAVDNTRIDVPSPEDCITAAPGSVMYFGVDGSFLAGSAAGYTIAVEPVDVKAADQSTPLPDFVSPVGAHLYSVSTTTGASYDAAITGLDDDANLYMMTGPSLTGTVNCPDTEFAGTVPEDCMVTAGTGSVFFIVDGIFGTKTTENYTVLVAPAPNVSSPANQGSIGLPVPVSVNTPTVGQVGSAPSGTSYYQVAVTQNQAYTVSITGLSNDADLMVFGGDATFTTPVSCTIDNTAYRTPPTTPESCTVTATGTNLYFATTSFSTGTGVSYIILVSPGPP